MKDVVYYFVFNGLSDWEAALALAEIHKSKRYDVRTVALSAEPVETAAGLRLFPDVTLSEIDGRSAAAFVVPGGTLWEEGGGEYVDEVVLRLRHEGAVIATICGGTLVAARTGLLEDRRFTSNMPGYIEMFTSSFEAGDRYESSDLSVVDRGVITASAVGSVEFARDLLRELGIYDEPGLAEWFALFKYGRIPARYA